MNPRSVESRISSMASYLDHEFANYIQMISGWLQIGESEKALEAAKAAQKALTERSRIRRLLSEEDSVMVLEWLSESASRGVVTVVAIRHKIRPLWPDLRQTIFDALCALTEVCEEVSLTFSDCVAVTGTLSSYAKGGALESLAAKLGNICKSSPYKLVISDKAMELRIELGGES